MHERVIERKVKNGLATSSMHMHARVHAWCTRTLINICMHMQESIIYIPAGNPHSNLSRKIFQDQTCEIFPDGKFLQDCHARRGSASTTHTS